MTLTTSFRLAIGGLALALGLFGGAAHAQGSKRIINLETIATYPPFIYKEPGAAKLTGFDIDLLNALAAQMGVELNFIETSFAQMTSFAALKTGRADMASGGLSDIPQRREVVNMVAYIDDPIRFYVLRSNMDAFRSADALCGKKVALTRTSPNQLEAANTFSAETCVKAGKPPMINVSSDNSVQSQQMINQGRVDTAITGAGALAYQNTVEGNKYMPLSVPLGKFTYAWAIKKDDMKFAETVKTALNALIADGSYDRILRKWNLSTDSSIQRAMINGQP